MRCVTNSVSSIGLTFSGEGLQYIQCLRLHHTSERPIVIDDNVVFLYCPHCVFTPEQPCRTLFSITHVRYIVVQQRGPIYNFDRVDILYNFVEMDPLFPKIQCAYDGTYLLFVRPHDLTRDVRSGPSNLIPSQSSVSFNRPSSILPTSGRNSLRRPSTALPPTTVSAAGSSRANALSILPAVEYDSDDSQVKKKIKVASMDWQGQTYYITGKESVIVILRDTSSVRTLMEDGQLQL